MHTYSVEVTIAATQRRPMGFGFVTFKTPESAKKAIEDYNLIEFNNRKIAVEQAMDKSSLYRSGYRPRRGRGKGRGSRYGGSYPSRRGGVSSRDGRYHGSLARIDGNQPSSDDANEDANAEDQTSADRNISGTASQLGDEIPQSHQDASDSAFGGIDDVTGGAQHGDQDEEYQEGQYPQSHTGRNRSRPPRGRGRGRGRGARGRGGSRRDYDNGSYSATTLFITNLPYDVLEPELSELFEDYKVSKISVMKFKDDTSKGYGFVELETHDEQQRVLSELQEVVIGQRSIVIKPAFPHPRYGNKQQRQSNGEVDIKSSEDEEEEEEQHNKPPQPSQPRDSKNP